MLNKSITFDDIPEKKLKDLLNFPCSFTFKVIGINRDSLVEDVISVIQKYVKGDYNPQTKLSSNGKYNSVSVDIIAENIEQIETLYAELAKIEKVRMVL